MYNRYIPAEDGSYRKEPVAEAPEKPAPPAAPAEPKAERPDLLVPLLLLALLSDGGKELRAPLVAAMLYLLLP